MGSLKVIFLAGLLAGIAALSLIVWLGIERYPPMTTLADGRQAYVAPSDVRLCAAALSALADRQSQQQWHACAKPKFAWPERRASHNFLSP